MNITGNKMADAVNGMANRGVDALGARLNTQIVRENRGNGQLTENALKVQQKGAEMIGAKEKTAAKGAEMIHATQELVRKGSEALDANLDVKISKGLGSGQMVDNVNKMLRKGSEMIGVAEKESTSKTALVDNVRKLVSEGVEKLGAQLDTKISQGLGSGQMAKNVQEMNENFIRLRETEPKTAPTPAPMREVDLSA